MDTLQQAVCVCVLHVAAHILQCAYLFSPHRLVAEGEPRGKSLGKVEDYHSDSGEFSKHQFIILLSGDWLRT